MLSAQLSQLSQTVLSVKQLSSLSAQAYRLVLSASYGISHTESMYEINEYRQSADDLLEQH